VSIRDRVFDGIGSLLDRVKKGEQELSVVDAERLERELQARAKLGSKAAQKHPALKMAGPGDSARKAREGAAAAREGRIRGERSRKAAQARKSQEEAFRRMREEARANPGPRPNAGRRSSSRPRGSKGSKGGLAEHYKVLDLEPGSDFAAVKKAYRGLMRKYHPDLHQDPRKKKAATELTLKVTQAYNALEEALKNG
jgi:DnaJ-domain-containing protein 1